MTARVTTGLRLVQLIASRPDPTEPAPVGFLAAAMSASLSGTSRLCAELEHLGLLERGEGYGAYRLGPVAIQLSGRAAAPFAKTVRFALTRAAQKTGETVCLAAPSPDGFRVVSVVDSPWTLHAPAALGELAEDDGAIALAGQGWGVDALGAFPRAEVTSGKRVEVALPVLDPLGETVAVVAARLPVYRAKRGVPQAGSALTTARRILERELTAGGGAGRDEVRLPADAPVADEARLASSLEAALRILQHLAGGADAAAGIARATGLRLDRTRRLLESCRRSGLVTAARDGVEHRLAWVVHGWYRAAAPQTLVQRGRHFVAEAAEATGACAFLTVLKGMRSFTLVEELAVLGEGLVMRPWLGKPHPIVGSDGGPTLVMDLTPEQLAEIFPSRHTPQEFERFLDRVRRAVRDGVLALESIEEFGITSVSAPVRDASGTVAAAACIVGATEYVKPRLGAIQAAARQLAEQVSALLV
ncbi:IclR family transcriptional regulator C-terminal domain-containing protein [Microbacterium sp. 18062]|uniref:IclR family transcriptional regulator domain-containing protein n=1 Tax=Microbacterium sp. 18062 TaxID=2681410 RepID=UPI00135747B6|nr:IclR family transcriptional regulator C-terminal domain-containing protein [Microbacterium sp. 18062]